MALDAYKELSANYPTESREELYAALGGEWPTLIDNPNYQNTCAIRLSVAFHAANRPIPNSFKEGVAGDGRAIIFKVTTMEKFIKQAYGGATWGMTKKTGSSVKVPAQKGIIVYHKAFSDATGHFDLWDGADFVGSGNWQDAKDGYDIALWY